MSETDFRLITQESPRFICGECQAEPISPLQHAWEAASKLILAARKGLPVVYTPCVMAGGTVPSTMAGILTQGLAESLSGLVLNQSTREGSPFIMGGVFTIMDMSSTIFSYGSPEFNLLMSSLADLAHYLKLPMFGTAGCSDSNDLDPRQVQLVSLSTTLATNAIVEGRGCRVGLILIGHEPIGDLPAQKVLVVRGGHDIKGVPVTELDVEAVQKAVSEMRGQVDTVAISGYLSIRNPEHEQITQSIIQGLWDVPIVCAHQLTTALGFHE